MGGNFSFRDGGYVQLCYLTLLPVSEVPLRADASPVPLWKIVVVGHQTDLHQVNALTQTDFGESRLKEPLILNTCNGNRIRTHDSREVCRMPPVLRAQRSLFGKRVVWQTVY